MTVTLTTAMFAGATVAAVFFFIGLFIGLLAAEGYKSKRICNECLRRLAQTGFTIDGKDYTTTCKEGC